MQNIIGQEKLVNKLKSYNFISMPKTLLFIGESGCGKHFISDRFSKYLGIDLVEITTQTTAEELIEYYQSSLPRIYLINLSNFVEKQQHKFLKFIEEPSSNMRVILTAESEVGILPTILNRCIKYIFEDYSIEQLKQLNWILTEENELIYKICKTPGQLLTLASVDNLDQIQLACEYLIKSIVGMPYLACINLSYQINYKDEFKKFDFDLFFRMLIQTAYEEYILNRNEMAFELYKYLINRKQLLVVNKTLAKEAFMLTTLDELWRVAN